MVGANITTEKMHPNARGLDLRSDKEILTILLESQFEAVRAVGTAIEDLARGAAAIVKSISEGGRLIYAAAGSSGMLALADGLEIPPTFGIPSQLITVLRAGGFDNMSTPKEGAEDDDKAATRDAEIIKAGDCVICLAASGNTIYPVTIMQIAQRRGALVIGIANNPGTKLLEADIPILLPTPPEVISGSTRLAAGTAQKIALNLMSTLVGIRMGHVMDGLMVNVTASNTKLKERAERIVCAIAGGDMDDARQALELTDWSVKEAVLLRTGMVSDLREAQNVLSEAGGNLRTALTNLKNRKNPDNRVITQQLGEKK